MIDEDLQSITDDFQDFLMKIVLNYEVSYPALCGIIMAQMVNLAQESGHTKTVLNLLPYMEKNLRNESNGRFH
jgi:hypothetical protein